MIDVNYIYNRVSDLSAKHKSGYITNDQFNRDLTHMQDLLFRYYVDMYASTKRVVDVMATFVDFKSVKVIEGLVTPPNNFEHMIEGTTLLLENDCDGEVIVTEHPIYRLINDRNMTLSSPIRKPSKTKNLYYYDLMGESLYIYPEDVSGRMRIKYFRKPNVATRAVTIDTTTDDETYDEDNSTQLEWKSIETDNIIDIMLFFKGVQIRETNLLQWVGAKRATYPQKT